MKIHLIALALAAVAGLAPAAPQQGRIAVKTREFNRFIFFAVLEGLYEDGVPKEVVDRILQKGDRYTHFVYACPICTPVVEAFRAFSMRGEYHYSWKDEDGAYLGRTLPEELLKTLKDPSIEVFRDGMEKLIRRFLRRRMDLLRFTADDRNAFSEAMEMGRKEGMSSLPASNPGLKKCPSCEAGVGSTTQK